MRINVVQSKERLLIRQPWALVAVVALTLAASACAPAQPETVRLTGTPLVSLDEGVGEVLLRQAGLFQGAPLDTLTRVGIEPDTRIEMEGGRRVRAADINGSELPEYLGGFRVVELEAQRHGTELVATAINRSDTEAYPVVFETWPNRCGTEPGVFVGILGASSKEVRDGRSSPGFEFTTARSDGSGPASWYMITAWAAPGSTVPVDGKPLDVSAREREFEALVDRKLVTLQLRLENHRWYLQSVEIMRDADGAWPPGS